MIPLWQHIGAVIALLVSNGFTAWWGLRRIRELQDALQAKAVLMGGAEEVYWAEVARGMREGGRR